jgi:hypothetical protein
MYVEIDNDLAELLEQNMHLDETHDQVVNRLLRRALSGTRSVPRAASPTGRTRVVVAGNLDDLLQAGLVEAGDGLTYVETRRGIVHKGTVTADGRVATDGGSPTSPSTALGQLVGYSINGWKCWTHVPSGKTLSTLRGELPS